jgi:magnesium chelatase subunit I
MVTPFRSFQKTSYSDVTVVDLIGDIDPIAANLKLSYADDRVIHFGMIPSESIVASCN